MGGLEAEFDWSDGGANDETFAHFDNGLDYAVDSGSGSTASGGQLVPSSTAAKTVRFKRGVGGPGCTSRDGEVVVGFTAASNGDTTDTLLDYYDVSNHLACGCDASGALTIYKRVSGSPTTLATGSAGTVVTGAPAWVVGRRQGSLLKMCQLYNRDPALGGSPLGTPLTHTLSTADQATFANPGLSGFRIFLGSTSYRVDGYRFRPYSNVGVVSASQDAPALVYGAQNATSEAVMIVYSQWGAASECELQDVRLDGNLLGPGRSS